MSWSGEGVIRPITYTNIIPIVILTFMLQLGSFLSRPVMYSSDLSEIPKGDNISFDTLPALPIFNQYIFTKHIPDPMFQDIVLKNVQSEVQCPRHDLVFNTWPS